MTRNVPRAHYLPLSGRRQLIAWRIRKELSPQQLALRLGVKPSTVHNWEAGHARPSFDTAAYIERLMGIPMRDWAKARRA